MRFKTDENLPAECALLLRSAGLQADTVAEEDLPGVDDSVIAQKVRNEGRVLITLDLDFANIQEYPPGTHPGIIVLRPRRQDKRSVLELMVRAIPRSGQDSRPAICGSSSQTAFGSADSDKPSALSA